MKIPTIAISLFVSIGMVASVDAQGPGRGGPPMRKHTVNQKKDWEPVPATEMLIQKSKHDFDVSDREIKVDANGIPEHKVGKFPNGGNPHQISAQAYDFLIKAQKTPPAKVTPLHNDSGSGPPNTPFGIAVNGVLFDPGTAEFYKGDRKSDWNYEALSGAVRLGVDANNAHVQPSGAYHYHGLPWGLMRRLKVNPAQHSPLIGYAMDGYPIYALFGFQDPKDPKSAIVKLKSSYRLKQGKRPAGSNDPGGVYDGAFTKDYEYVKGHGDLDECNGRFSVTAEYPKGTYAYFLTEAWPVIPRNFKGTPLKLRSAPPHGHGPPRR